MTFKDLVRTFAGCLCICSFLILFALLIFWPNKHVVGMGASIMALISYLVFVILGGLKGVGH